MSIFDTYCDIERYLWHHGFGLQVLFEIESDVGFFLYRYCFVCCICCCFVQHSLVTGHHCFYRRSYSAFYGIYLIGIISFWEIIRDLFCDRYIGFLYAVFSACLQFGIDYRRSTWTFMNIKKSDMKYCCA